MYFPRLHCVYKCGNWRDNFNSPSRTGEFLKTMINIYKVAFRIYRKSLRIGPQIFLIYLGIDLDQESHSVRLLNEFRYLLMRQRTVIMKLITNECDVIQATEHIEVFDMTLEEEEVGTINFYSGSLLTNRVLSITHHPVRLTH